MAMQMLDAAGIGFVEVTYLESFWVVGGRRRLVSTLLVFVSFAHFGNLCLILHSII